MQRGFPHVFAAILIGLAIEAVNVFIGLSQPVLQHEVWWFVLPVVCAVGLATVATGTRDRINDADRRTLVGLAYGLMLGLTVLPPVWALLVAYDSAHAEPGSFGNALVLLMAPPPLLRVGGAFVGVVVGVRLAGRSA